ncbi:MAG: hypothetical protein IH948_02350 [Bacteroidetes bacterium]|nr:hypothetical protein [Bacteroidota bacterium]
MTNYTFKGVQDGDIETGSQGVYIWLFHADQTPPHLGITINGRYFSLLYNKLICNVDMVNVHRTIKSKDIPTLFVEVIQQKNIETDYLEIASEIFNEYEDISKTHITCLTPLKRTVEKIVNVDLSECNVIFDVLDSLLEAKIELRFHHLFLSKLIENDVFEMEHYGLNEVEQRIKKLRE